MKKRTRHTISQFSMRAIAFVVVFAMALSAWASMPMDVFAANSDFEISEDGILTKYKGSGGDVVIPSSLTRIDSEGKAITINVTSIGYEAFRNCNNLKSVILPNSVTYIGRYAFNECSSLTSIIIPNSVREIGSSAFEDCSSLNNITIPNSVTEIEPWAFQNCTSLTKISIPKSVTFIQTGLFDGCSSLSTVTIPDSVTEIGAHAFCACCSLNNVTIPNSVTVIGDWAFKYCSSLTKISIPDDVTYIGEYVFSQCSSLRSVRIGRSVTKIDNDAFNECYQLIDVYYSGTQEDWEKIEIGSNNFLLSRRATIHYNSTDSADESVDNREFVIEDGVLTKYRGNGGRVVIPNSVTSIGNEAFSHWTNITSVKIPSTVTSIGNGAFSYCTGLTSVIISNMVTSIGNAAFLGCTSLTSVTIPKSITSIGDNVFYNCKALTDIYYSGSESQWKTLTSGQFFMGAFHYRGPLRIYVTIHYNSTGPDDEPGQQDDLSPTPGEFKIWLHNGSFENYGIVGEDASISASYDAAKAGEVEKETKQIKWSFSDDSMAAFSTDINRSWSYSYDKKNASLMGLIKCKKAGKLKLTGVAADGRKATAEINIEPKMQISIPHALWEDGKIICSVSLSEPNKSYLTSFIKGIEFFHDTDEAINGGMLEVKKTSYEVADDGLSASYTVFVSPHFPGKMYVGFKSALGQKVKETIGIPDHVVDVTYRSDGEKSKIGDKKYKDASHSFYYSDRFFYYDNTSYHNDLAVISLGMEMASFTTHDADDNYTKNYSTDANGYCDRAKNIKKFYDDLGFKNARFYNYDKTLADSSDKVAYSFASRSVTNGENTDTLVTVVVRGGEYGAEWASNFHVDNSGNHVGFQTAANEVYRSLAQYLGEIKKNTEGEIKLWITGYSRGAAVANLSTHLINKNSLVKFSNIYAYTFATPSGYRIDSSNTVRDDNIFNIVSANDVVPKVALSLWGFSKYGQTKIFPSYTPSEVASCFNNLTGDKLEINNAYNAEKALTNFLYDICPTTDAYCKTLQDEIWGFFADFKSNNDLNKTNRIKHLGEGICSFFDSEEATQKLVYAFALAKGEELIYNCTNKDENVRWGLTHIAMAHYPEHYLAWLETGGGNSVEEGKLYANFSDSQKEEIEKNLKVHFTRSYQLHQFFCPVDVKVYDSSNHLVVSIVNNKVEVEKLPCYVVGDTKYVYTYGDNYRIELTGNGTGTMDYQVQEFNSDSEMVRTVNHYDLALTKGKTYTGQSKNTILDKTNTYALTTNSNTVKPAYDSLTPVGSKHKITIVNGGSLTESAYQNECVEIFAEDVEGKKFSHWTSDAGDGIFNDANSQATNFVMPNKDVKITAVYVDAEKTGDVNGDSKVNGKDATRLMQYLAGWDVEIDQSAADVNGDGKVNGKDATRLMQYLAGWDVALG